MAGECLHLVLEGGDDWRTPLQQVFNKKLGPSWNFLVMELQSGVAHFHVLKPETKPVKTYLECAVLWLTALYDDNASSASAPPKPKTIKKVVKKLATDKAAAGTTDGKAASKTGKVSRKKVAASITTAPALAAAASPDTKAGNDASACTLPSKKDMDAKLRNSLTNGTGAAGNDSSCTNGDGSGDSGVSVVDSDSEKSPKNKKATDFDEQDSTSPSQERVDTASGEYSTAQSKSNPQLK
ncbi:unnamed protein product, partial [Gongylonema pulchrum]